MSKKEPAEKVVKDIQQPDGKATEAQVDGEE